MATKFAQFLQDNKIDPRRIVAVSKRIERLRPEDRKLKSAKKASKGEGAIQRPILKGFVADGVAEHRFGGLRLTTTVVSAF